MNDVNCSNFCFLSSYFTSTILFTSPLVCNKMFTSFFILHNCAEIYNQIIIIYLIRCIFIFTNKTRSDKGKGSTTMIIFIPHSKKPRHSLWANNIVFATNTLFPSFFLSQTFFLFSVLASWQNPRHTTKHRTACMQNYTCIQYI